jgi:hypothetical protein
MITQQQRQRVETLCNQFLCDEFDCFEPEDLYFFAGYVSALIESYLCLEHIKRKGGNKST